MPMNSHIYSFILLNMAIPHFVRYHCVCKHSFTEAENSFCVAVKFFPFYLSSYLPFNIANSEIFVVR